MEKKQVSLRYLFFTFLKIGSFSFGGFMSLVAMIQNQLTEKDKTIDENTVLNGISLTSLLPGPVAMNTVAFVGYKLRGLTGALVSLVGALIPSFFLISFLSHLYFSYGEIHEVKAFFKGVLPAIFSLIIVTALGMGQKSIHDKKQISIAILAALSLILLKGEFLTILLLIGGALMGFVLYRKEFERNCSETSFPKKALLSVVLLLMICLLGGPLLEKATETLPTPFPEAIEILTRFSSLSVTLFGGGYVFIPLMQELLVENYAWLSQQEFIDGIALGQMTPGPIMITSTFVGYKLMGLLGAFLATTGMFLPPALLTIYSTRMFDALQSSRIIQSAFKGIKPVVVGMVFAAGFIVAKGFDSLVLSSLIATVSFVLLYLKKMNLILLILGTGLIGLFLF